MNTKIKMSMTLVVFTISIFALGQHEWPILKKYEQEYLKEIKMPVGGIGTGTISLAGLGGFQDWEIMNRPAKGFNPGPEGRLKRSPFFSIYVEDQKGNKTVKLLEGPLQTESFEGQEGSTYPNHGLPRFSSASFATAYPFGQVFLKDSNLPVKVTVGAYNPLIPGNPKDSGIPMAIITYEVKNTSSEALNISVNGNLENFIGYDGFKGKSQKNRNEYRDQDDVKGIYFTSDGVDKNIQQWGTMALVSLTEGEISHRTSWIPAFWGNSILDFWDDFSADGILDNRENSEDTPLASLAVKKTIEPGDTQTFKFLLTWHFPNRKAWGSFTDDIDITVGNYYANHYQDAWDVVKKELPRIDQLEDQTLEFVRTFLSSDIPDIVKEASLFNLSSLRTQLAFRIKSGHLLGYEGNFQHIGSGYGSCTHVWNYEHTIPFLFGELAKTMRDVEFNYATNEEGLMSFRVGLPLEENGQEWKIAAADGQMGTIIKVYRDWQLSGDDEMLGKLWPKIKQALSFAWITGGWDADQDGIMEGSQHNTMDVEYFGPNPQMGFMYLGALKAGEQMALFLGEKKFAKKCATLYQNGSKWLDENLFNGEYYEQDVRPPMTIDNIAPGLRWGSGSSDLSSPDYQLGKGVLIDQLIGNVLAHTSGLGYLGDKENSRKTHEAILKYNYRENLVNHPNFMRSYALGDEAGILMAGYPGERPQKPFPYFSEVMTGFEYTAIIGMLYDGLIDEGLRSIENIRDRYDGLKRNPFNEAEYGNHYARAMAAWGTLIAYTGFRYSAKSKSMSFNPRNGKYFWSNGYQYGSVEILGDKSKKSVKLSVNNGRLALRSFELNGFGEIRFKKGKEITKGEILEFEVY